MVLLSELRHMMENMCFVALAGMQSSGKSTLTQRLTGVMVSMTEALYMVACPSQWDLLSCIATQEQCYWTEHACDIHWQSDVCAVLVMAS